MLSKPTQTGEINCIKGAIIFYWEGSVCGGDQNFFGMVKGGGPVFFQWVKGGGDQNFLSVKEGGHERETCPPT